MPIYLPAPQPPPGGPDGEGWNRISLGAHYGTPSPECALRPRSYPALYNMRRGTIFSQFGYHGNCIRPPKDAKWADPKRGSYQRPDCRTCPVFTALPVELDADDDRVLVRLERRIHGEGLWAFGTETPYVVENPARGWDSPKQRWEWDALARLTGWRIGRAYYDEHSAGFWLIREPEIEVSARRNAIPLNGSTAAPTPATPLGGAR
ncbi:hypothetical protein [Nocardia transvalensis]|uniref:hypothetical protein n=1 Tax=Nocardia transvalensis TaxID=37333 RepID=UPI0018956AE6|nr:hypothetical protein [Nocardia transvalensis]MBF6333486.1 hypothetical protein [Nocardia transvalensis]